MHFSYFPGIQGLLVTATIALLMSTADSYWHIASTQAFRIIQTQHFSYE
ncbi:MAG: hypothetical protein NQ127_03680 [Candidatus Cardinium sp.]|nr:hypothetical protein [Candidatus Cardinium sp.]